MNLFFDTSALVKFFYEEIGTVAVSSLINNSHNQVWISELTIIELLNAAYRLYREHQINDEELRNAIDGFEEEFQRFIVIPLNIAVISEAKNILSDFGKDFPLRTLDVLQISSCSLVYEKDEEWAVISSDKRMNTVFRDIGIKIIDPEEQDYLVG